MRWVKQSVTSRIQNSIVILFNQSNESIVKKLPFKLGSRTVYAQKSNQK